MAGQTAIDSLSLGTSTQGYQLNRSQCLTSERPLISNKTKNIINVSFNGISSAANLITFINCNFLPLTSSNETLEKASSFLTKCATVAQGVVNTTIEWEKKNLLALIGAVLELPIAFFTSGFNLFLARGVAAGMNQFDGVISCIPRTKDGKIIYDKDGKIKYYNSFKEDGWLSGTKILLSKFPLLTKDIFTKPLNKEGLFPRSSFLCSSLMIAGPLIFLAGFEKIGSGIRDFFGGLEAIVLMTHKDPDKNKAAKNTSKPGFSFYFLSGVVWTIGALTDYLKRLDFISDKFSNFTELSMFLDRTGAIFYIFGNQEFVSNE